MDVKQLKLRADEAKTLYRMGVIDRETAKKEIQPFLDAANKKSIELAKKYNQRPKKITLQSFLRSR